ncbi:MAG TPA: archease [Actinomycetota bacterium]
MGEGLCSDAGHEFLEHTADLGIRAWGPAPERAFEEAALALVRVLDVPAERGEDTVRVELDAEDRGGLLVALLNELVFLVETRGQGVAAVHVLEVAEQTLVAEVGLGTVAHRPEGTVVKAATYHRLSVEVEPGGATVVRVFLDV